jgi:hypothetical protein
MCLLLIDIHYSLQILSISIAQRSKSMEWRQPCVSLAIDLNPKHVEKSSPVLASQSGQRISALIKERATCIQSLSRNPHSLLNDVLRQRQTRPDSTIDRRPIALLRLVTRIELPPSFGIVFDVFHHFMHEG